MPSTRLGRLVDKCRELNGYGFPRLGRTGFDLVYRLLPRQMDTKLLPGIWAELDFSDEVQQAAYWLGSRMESPTIPALSHWVRDSPAPLFFDIGSNFGFFSFQLISRFPELPVHAFEPNPNTFTHLKSIIERNQLNAMTAWPIGLGDESGEALLQLGVTDSGHSTFGLHPEMKSKSVPARIDTFENWRKEGGLEFPSTPSWIAKIDVEGYECKVLAGMKAALQAQAFRGLTVEVNAGTLEFCGSSVQEMVDLMERSDYVRLDSITLAAKRHRLGQAANAFFVPRGLAA